MSKCFYFLLHRSEQARQLYATRKEQAKSIDCSLMSERKERGPRSTGDELQPQSRSKSSDNVFEQSQAELSLDSNTLKRMLHPLPQGNSVHSSPEQVKIRIYTCALFYIFYQFATETWLICKLENSLFWWKWTYCQNAFRALLSPSFSV